MLLFLCSCSTVQHFFGASGTDVLFADNPLGVTDLKSGTLMTLAESKPISGNQVKVKFSNTTEPKRTELVAAKFGDELRLIDFLIPGVNEKPQLSFASTARGLVFINPLFLGLPFEARVAIFQDIPKHPEFETLKRKITSSKSLSEDNLIETEMKIAIDIAKKRGLLTSSSVTSNKGLDAGNRESSKPNSATELSSETSFDRETFPKAVCGDQLPSDSKVYPVDLYPVFTDYSEKNLKVVTTELCQDAIRSTRQKTNKQSIQVGSFIGKTRAEEFKSFIQKKLGNAEVGEPTRIESKRVHPSLARLMLRIAH
jgi:hypothetical protein